MSFKLGKMKILWFSRHAFPSPHGDKFQLYQKYAKMGLAKFPSPHGDKFQQPMKRMKKRNLCFRPLTGINFNKKAIQFTERYMFPSPRGDKSQLLHIMIWMLHDGFRPLTGINFNACYVLTQRQFLRFPSPLGDKFQRQICDFCLFRRAFPSPHGDKFQPKKPKGTTCSLRFRPLTGINFNYVVPKKINSR